LFAAFPETSTPRPHGSRSIFFETRNCFPPDNINYIKAFPDRPGYLSMPTRRRTMPGDDSADPSGERDWVTYLIGTLLAFECTILVVTLIWL
jgi:hypothetical protein